jgi:hypothetical protein
MNAWLDKPITEGWFLEGLIAVGIGFCGFVGFMIDKEFYAKGVLYVIFALLKNIAIDLDGLRGARKRADRTDRSGQKKRRQFVRRGVVS